MPCDSQFLFLISCFGNVGQLLKAYKPRMTFEFLCDIQIRIFFFFFFWGGLFYKLVLHWFLPSQKIFHPKITQNKTKYFQTFHVSFSMEGTGACFRSILQPHLLAHVVMHDACH